MEILHKLPNDIVYHILFIFDGRFFHKTYSHSHSHSHSHRISIGGPLQSFVKERLDYHTYSVKELCYSDSTHWTTKLYDKKISPNYQILFFGIYREVDDGRGDHKDAVSYEWRKYYYKEDIKDKNWIVRPSSQNAFRFTIYTKHNTTKISAIM